MIRRRWKMDTCSRNDDCGPLSGIAFNRVMKPRGRGDWRNCYMWIYIYTYSQQNIGSLHVVHLVAVDRFSVHLCTLPASPLSVASS